MEDNHALSTPFLGCPIWNHPKWGKSGLPEYSQFCNSVEGNTTFYQTPSTQRAQEWATSVTDSFRFAFKLPQVITHQNKLIRCDELLKEFWQALTPLHKKIGLLMAQLPASFGPESLYALERFVSQFPLPVPLAVEVRHPDFFKKGETEIQLNRLLIDNKVNRVIFDSRALFAHPPASEIETDVQSKKPYLPVNVIATHDIPVVRFIGGNNLKTNENALLPWIKKCHQWRLENKQPFIFFHRPDNADAPNLLAQFVDMYNQTYQKTSLSHDISQLLPASLQTHMAF